MSAYSGFVNLLTLLSLALIVSAQVPKTFKYVFFREDCFDLYFNKFDFFSNKECLKITFSKGIGFALIAGSCILKLPQILKIFKAKSVEGISKYMFYTEILMLMHSSSYSMQAKIPFTVYGESVIILFQNYLIVLMFWVYAKEIGAAEKAGMFALFASYAFILFSGDRFLTQEHWKLVQQSNLALSLLSRVPQILTNFSNKSTGQLAFFTFFLSFVGVVARLGTVLIETDDFLYQLQYILSVILNGIIVLQFVLYWNNTAAPPSKKVESGKPASGKAGKATSSGKSKREKIE